MLQSPSDLEPPRHCHCPSRRPAGDLRCPGGPRDGVRGLGLDVPGDQVRGRRHPAVPGHGDAVPAGGRGAVGRRACAPRARGLPDHPPSGADRGRLRPAAAGRRQRTGRRRRAGRRLRARRAAGCRHTVVGGAPAAVLRDRPSLATVAGLLLGLGGVAVLLVPGLSGSSEIGPLLLVCLSSVLWACGTVLSTRRPMPSDPFVTTVVEMAAGGTAMVALGSLGGEWQRLEVGAVPASSWIAFGYLVLVGSVVGYSAFVWLLARAPLSLATTYAYVNPAVAVALGALLLDEPLTPSVVLGGAVIIAAVALVLTAESRARRRTAPTVDAGAAPLEPA